MSYAARLLNRNTAVDAPQLFDVYKKPGLRRAVTTTSIVYHKDGNEVLVAQGTSIWVDTANGIALIGHDHTDISDDEYALA